MTARFKTLFSVFLLLAAAGCGQKGPLVAPPRAPDETATPAGQTGDTHLIDEFDE